MDTDLLRKHIKEYVQHLQTEKLAHEQDIAERQERTDYYRVWGQGVGSGLAFTHFPLPLSTFLNLQTSSRFAAGSCGEYSTKQRQMPDDTCRA